MTITPIRMMYKDKVKTVYLAVERSPGVYVSVVGATHSYAMNKALREMFRTH